MIRPFAHTTKEDIENEVRMIMEICNTNGHRNIVQVLNHGSLPSSDYIFIDMELCDLNLADYITGKRSLKPTQTIAGSTNMAFVPEGSSLPQKLQNAWIILCHIVGGVKFLHERKYVHRDLKPRNGTLHDSLARQTYCV